MPENAVSATAHDGDDDDGVESATTTIPTAHKSYASLWPPPWVTGVWKHWVVWMFAVPKCGGYVVT